MISADEVAFVQQVAARDLLARAARVCSDANIQVMALKGAWLLEAVLPQDHARPLADVDLLVRPGDFERARRAFGQAGFRERASDPRQVTLRSPGDPLAVDLHHALFDPGSFRLSPESLFARANEAVTFAGGGVAWMPAAPDGFAHLVGHATHCRLRPRDAIRMQDFEMIGQQTGLDAGATAAHLDDCGMRRAARYVLGAADQGPFCRAVIAALPADPLGVWLARGCGWLIPRTDARRRLGGALSYLLEDNLVSGAQVMSYRARVAATQRWTR